MGIAIPRRGLLAAAALTLAANHRLFAEETIANWPNKAIFAPSQDKNERAPVVSALCVHPEGNLVAAAGDNHLIRIFDIAAGKQLHELEGHTDWVRALDFSPDGALLVSVGQDGRVQLWSASEGREIRQLHRIGNSLQSIKFSRDGKRLYCAGIDDHLRVIDVESGHVTASWKCSSTDIRTVAVSLDDSLIAAAGRDGVIRIWKQDGELVHDLPAHHRRIRNLQFSNAGSALYSVGDDKVLRVDDVVDPTKGFDLPVAQGKLLSLAVINDEIVAAGASNNKIYIWNTDTKELVGELQAHTGSVSALCSTTDSLISSGYDATIRVWTVGENVAAKPAKGFQGR